MLKKIISLFMIFAMLVPVSSAVAADENASQPTIEEILNGYHEKAFAAKTAEENSGVSTYGLRSGSEKTLEEETVDELTAVGYEAYHLTADNYESLEASLKTDFSGLGLDSGNSYIVVISGEEESATSNSSRANDVLLPPHIGSEETGGDENAFAYQYNGTSYTMRYVTITNADMSNDELFKDSSAILSNIDYFNDISSVFGEYMVSFAAEKALEKLFEEGGVELVKMVPYAGTIATIASLLVDVGEAATQNPVQYVDPDTWFLCAGTAWTRNYIEIYDANVGSWCAVQCSSYAHVESSMYGPYVYDPDSNGPSQLGGIAQSATLYSTYYSDTATRKLYAVQAYLGDYFVADGTGDIEYYFTNPTDPDAASLLIFTHEDYDSY